MACDASEQREIVERLKAIEEEIGKRRRASSQIERDTIDLQSDVSWRISWRSAPFRSVDELLGS
jgi:hypothetical protein